MRSGIRKWMAAAHQPNIVLLLIWLLSSLTGLSKSFCYLRTCPSYPHYMLSKSQSSFSTIVERGSWYQTSRCGATKEAFELVATTVDPNHKKIETKKSRVKGVRATKKKSTVKNGDKEVKDESKGRKKRTKKKNTSKEPLYWRVDSDEFVFEFHPVLSNDTTTSGNEDAPSPNCKMLRFTVRGKPVPLRRHRTSRGFMYNPSAQAQDKFREVVQNITFPAIGVFKPVFVEGTYLIMTLVFRLKRPRNHFVGSKAGPGRLRPTAPKRLAPSRTDIDNLAKFVLDSLNELLYEDDRQIVSIRATKILDTEGDCLGATEVCIQSLDEHEIDDFLKGNGIL